MPELYNSNERFISLDVFRGLVIIGMIIVNLPGSSQENYVLLGHAAWNGVTLASLVLPFFLFIVGVSITLSYTTKIEKGVARAGLYRKIFIRFLKLCLIGVFLDFWYHFDIEMIRWTGVLQRIAIVFAVCSTLFICTRWKQQVLISATILAVYWALLCSVPVPIDDVNWQALQNGKIERAHLVTEPVHIETYGEQHLKPNLEPGTNLAAWLDRRVLPGRLYGKTWDPEGILSTLPALVSSLLGVLIGQVLISTRDKRRLTWLLLAGFGCLAGGYVWSWFLPMNKHLWTSSFVLWTAGLAMLSLMVIMIIVDKPGCQRLMEPALVFGSNAITAFILSTMLDPVRWWAVKGISINGLIMNLLSWFSLSAKNAALVCAIIYAFVVYLPLYFLYRKRIFIRL